jgi:type VI secretion system secreted protein VgrG
MPTYTQQGRPMRVRTALGPDVLLLHGFEGEEGVSRPFNFRLQLLSESPDLGASGILRTPVVLEVDCHDGTTRYIHGLARRFVQLDRADDLVAYEAEIVPWFWFLSRGRDIRIFQEMSVKEIVEKIFGDNGYTDFRWDLVGTYDKLEYCVQYRESSLDFVSRLLEEEGIFYYFAHTSAKHEMVLADHTGALPNVIGPTSGRMAPEPLPDEDVVLTVRYQHEVPLGKVTLTDYDYLQPSLNLESSAEAEEDEELYDYPGKYSALGPGERLARVRLEEHTALKETLGGTSTCRAMVTGHLFSVAEHYRGDVNATWILLEISHVAKAGDYRSWADAEIDYENHFVAVPKDTAYRPPRRTSKPTVHGHQTAVVVGPAGEEILVDKHARVKVQFHWDREGKKDEHSSCWIRISSTWAGKRWGFIQIPRIGQEVVVSFLEGDPDRPLVTGAVYNAEQVPPYALPASKTQSGVKSRSSREGSTANFNEIRFEDRIGSEELYIHAEKDKNVVVENDRTESVGRDERIDIGQDRTESVGRNETISVKGNRSETVEGDEQLTVKGKRSENVSKDEDVSVDKNREHTVGGDEKLTVAKGRKVSIGKDDVLDVSKKLTVTAGDQILIKTGQASITLKKDGTILIKGKDIKVQGSGKIDVKASAALTMKGSQVKQN